MHGQSIFRTSFGTASLRTRTSEHQTRCYLVLCCFCRGDLLCDRRDCRPFLAYPKESSIKGLEYFQEPQPVGFLPHHCDAPGPGVSCLKISRSQGSEKAGLYFDVGLPAGGDGYCCQAHISDCDHRDRASSILRPDLDGGENRAKVSANRRSFFSRDSIPSVPRCRRGSFCEVPETRPGLVRGTGNISGHRGPHPGLDGRERRPVAGRGSGRRDLSVGMLGGCLVSDYELSRSAFATQ